MVYTVIIAVSLTIILVSTNAQADNSFAATIFIFYTLLGYSIVSLVQLLGFKFIATQATRQLALFFIVDVICLSLLTFLLVNQIYSLVYFM